MAYRGGKPVELTCPRCRKAKLPPLDVAECPSQCGTWVSVFAASEVLTDSDRYENFLTRWWRVREPCPICGEKMNLCGKEPGLLQGCLVHGYFIDHDTIAHTGLAKGVDHDALDRKRSDEPRVEAEREALEIEANKRAAMRAGMQESAAAAARDAERRARIQRLIDDEDALLEALRASLGDEAASALLARLHRLEERVRRISIDY